MKITAHIPIQVDPEQIVESMNAYGIGLPPERAPVLDPRRNEIGYITDVRAVAEDKLEVVMEIEDEDVARALSADALRGVSLP